MRAPDQKQTPRLPGAGGIFGTALCLAYFAMGIWKFQKGWENPLHIGWMEGGVVCLAGAPLCFWLVWRRRHSDDNALLPILLLPQISEIVSDGLEWRAGAAGASWPWVRCFLAAALIILIVWEARMLRKRDSQEGIT